MAGCLNFYLQSHSCMDLSPVERPPRGNYLGTARSGHYVVIVNQSGYTPDMLQDIVSQAIPLKIMISRIR